MADLAEVKLDVMESLEYKTVGFERFSLIHNHWGFCQEQSEVVTLM